MEVGKKFWGPALWKTIHCFAASYTPDKKNSFKKFMFELQYLIPCEECKMHYINNLETFKMDNYMTNNHQLFLWSYLLHDIVNKQLGKHSPPYELVKIIYFKGLGSDCHLCKLN